jgi:hypothetical protein
MCFSFCDETSKVGGKFSFCGVGCFGWYFIIVPKLDQDIVAFFKVVGNGCP